MTDLAKHAIFLSGPIGVGKTTLGRALSVSLGGGFIDGDDHSDPDKPWYGSILRTSRSIVETGLNILKSKTVLVIAYPLTCVNWIYYKRKFGDIGVSTLFVALRARIASIVDERRGRIFDDDERARIQVMIAEGYGVAPFSDIVLDTYRDTFENTVARLASETRRLMLASHPLEC